MTTTTTSITLWEVAGESRADDIQTRFETFHAANPEVYRLFNRFAHEAIVSGHARMSADLILHRIRWYTMVETVGDTFKVNDHWTSRYARMWMERNPDYPNFFELRELKS